jgi:hypothetical protein
MSRREVSNRKVRFVMKVLFSWTSAFFVLLCFSGLAGAQRPEKRANPHDQTPLVNFEGTLQSIDSRKLILELDQDRVLEFRVTRKTEFDKDSKPIKSADLKKGDHVSIETREDVDLTLLAVKVHVVSLGRPADPK